MGMQYRYDKTYCSQCGGEFGPGNHGFSHCSDHLPKPSAWKVAHAGLGCLAVYDADDEAVAFLGFGESGGVEHFRNAEENARKIAALPDLIAALVDLVEQDECNRPDGRPLLDCEQAYAALAKVKGN